MKPILKYTLIGLLVAGLVGITAVGVAYAQGDPPQPLETIADLLGLTPDEVQEQLKDGKTLEDLANDAGSELEDLHKAMQETWLENFKTRIQSALEDDEITRDHANWLTEGLEKGFMGGRGGFGGRGRMGSRTDSDGPKPFGERPNFGDGPEMDGNGRPGSWFMMPRFNQ
ncbi:MAG: hypothetical protein MUO54_10795 [Anaerolineales bacterium]|nr:hypothetical protein [Anaerolineales bacterium]